MIPRTTAEEREIAVRLGYEAERLAQGMGMSARAVSLRANDNPDTIRQMQGGHVPNSLKLYRLATVLGTSMHDMMAAADLHARMVDVARNHDPSSTGKVRKGRTEHMLDLSGLGPASRLALLTLAEELKAGATTNTSTSTADD